MLMRRALGFLTLILTLIFAVGLFATLINYTWRDPDQSEHRMLVGALGFGIPMLIAGLGTFVLWEVSPGLQVFLGWIAVIFSFSNAGALILILISYVWSGPLPFGLPSPMKQPKIPGTVAAAPAETSKPKEPPQSRNDTVLPTLAEDPSAPAILETRDANVSDPPQVRPDDVTIYEIFDLYSLLGFGIPMFVTGAVGVVIFLMRAM